VGRYAIVPYAVAVIGGTSLFLARVAPDWSPISSCLTLGAAGVVAAITVAALVGGRSAWRSAMPQTVGLVLGSALLLGGLGYAVSYLDEDDDPTSPEQDSFAPSATKQGHFAPVAAFDTRRARFPRPRSPDASATLTVRLVVTSCDEPVAAVFALWPPRGAPLAGTFGFAIVSSHSAAARVRDPERIKPLPIGSDRDVYATDPKGNEIRLSSDSIRLPSRLRVRRGPIGSPVEIRPFTPPRPATANRPVIATLKLDWLLRRDSTSCYLELPLPGVAGPIGRGGRFAARITVSPTSNLRLDREASHPVPTESAKGQPQWACDGRNARCLGTAVIERADATGTTNFTLILVGTVIGLGASLWTQSILALAVWRRRDPLPDAGAIDGSSSHGT
jgi:hypothetical protein